MTFGMRQGDKGSELTQTIVHCATVQENIENVKMTGFFFKFHMTCTKEVVF